MRNLASTVGVRSCGQPDARMIQIRFCREHFIKDVSIRLGKNKKMAYAFYIGFFRKVIILLILLNKK